MFSRVRRIVELFQLGVLPCPAFVAMQSSGGSHAVLLLLRPRRRLCVDEGMMGPNAEAGSLFIRPDGNLWC